MNHLSRRDALWFLAATTGVVALNQLRPLRSVHAAPGTNPPLFLWLTMSGGWDQMLVLDPRDNTDLKFRSKGEDNRPGTADAPNGSGIRPGYHLIVDKDTKAVLAATKDTGVQKAGNLTFGPAVPPSLLEHATRLSIVRGLDMNTVAHEVGMRYTLTGKFPRGSAASGSSVATMVASTTGNGLLLPHVVLGGAETYNEGLAPFASGTRTSPTSLRSLLEPLYPVIGPENGGEAALAEYEAAAATCEETRENRDMLPTRMRQMNKQMRDLLRADKAAEFDFASKTPSPAVKDLLTRFGIVTNTDIAGPKGRMAAAAKLFESGFSSSASVVLQNDLDDHSDWHEEHATKLRAGLDALGDLIKFLVETKDKDNESLWSRTTLMLSSEFSRTPLINAREGRDHHITNSVLIAGPGIRSNVVFGATSDNGLQKQKIDFATGRPSESGSYVRPTDVVATLLSSMNVPLTPIENQNPKLLTALLKK
jgi:hypothetical protein